MRQFREEKLLLFCLTLILSIFILSKNGCFIYGLTLLKYDENKNCIKEYSDEDSKKLYFELNKNKLGKLISIFERKYKYKYIENSSGIIDGPTKKISDSCINNTNKKRSCFVDVNYVFDRLEYNWVESIVLKDNFQMNMPPETEMWIEFTPKLNYSSGILEKYYFTRNRPGAFHGQKVIEERKEVLIQSPVILCMNRDVNGKLVKMYDGCYAWIEKKIR